MKVQSYLPVFPGFYGTIFEYENEHQDIENEIESGYAPEDSTYDDFDWDYKEYHIRIAEACCSAIDLKELGITIEFQNLYSPREYNFTNDSINVEYTLGSIKPLLKYLKDNSSEFDAYIKEHCTSVSGFISFYSNDSKVWLDEYIHNIQNDSTILGRLLEFYLKCEEYTQEDLYEDLNDEQYVEFKLKEKV